MINGTMLPSQNQKTPQNENYIMNRYPRKQLATGNMVFSPVIVAEDLGYTSSAEELTQIVGKFNYKNVLVNLARINLFFQRIEDLSDEEILKQAFCPPVWLATIDGLRNLQGRPIFNRQILSAFINRMRSLF